MTIKALDNYFFSETSWDKDTCHKLVTNTLDGLDDGELYLQLSNSEAIVFDDNKVSNANFNIAKGFGFRGVKGDVASFAHSSEFSESALKQASEVVKSIKHYSNPVNLPLVTHARKNHKLYDNVDPIGEFSFEYKINIAKEIDDYIRSKNPYVRQVTVRISGGWSNIGIIKPNGYELYDFRPVSQLNISITLAKDGKLESAGEGQGARSLYRDLFDKKNWQSMADRALELATIKLDAAPAPAGEFMVILGPGDPGILLHEAVGHGIEGDFNRKKTSAFSKLLGKQVASKGVTVVDDGTIPYSRGSLNFDDEGTLTKRNILIEDGILVNYMQDRMNARLMKMEPTGNGRRESYASLPMPRMTNTFMLPGDATHEEIISSVNQAIYFPKFTGGQVDITSGRFVFEAPVAYLIEKGKLTTPIKGATLIGNGPDVMNKIKAVGNNLKIEGNGMCGKNGQSVPVGVGQPSLLIEKMTVGGTKVNN